MSDADLVPDLVRIIERQEARIAALEQATGLTGATNINDLEDVSVDVLTRGAGDSLVWDDGLQAWVNGASGSGTDLVFAKQMYGSVNDPGGGAPVTPFGGHYGGLFSKEISDPSTEDAGWMQVELQTDLMEFTWGSSFGADFGYFDFYTFQDRGDDSSGIYIDIETYQHVGNAVSFISWDMDVASDGAADFDMLMNAQDDGIDTLAGTIRLTIDPHSRSTNAGSAFGTQVALSAMQGQTDAVFRIDGNSGGEQGDGGNDGTDSFAVFYDAATKTARIANDGGPLELALPTSNPGGTDRLWNDGGTVKVT